MVLYSDCIWNKKKRCIIFQTLNTVKSIIFYFTSSFKFYSQNICHLLTMTALITALTSVLTIPCQCIRREQWEYGICHMP